MPACAVRTTDASPLQPAHRTATPHASVAVCRLHSCQQQDASAICDLPIRGIAACGISRGRRRGIRTRCPLFGTIEEGLPTGATLDAVRRDAALQLADRCACGGTLPPNSLPGLWMS